MVKQIIIRMRRPVFLTGMCLLLLTGCPGPGDRLTPDETAKVTQKGENVCFSIDDSRDYQPANIGINPRGTLSKDKNFYFSPDLTIADDLLCIPPSFYRFPDKGQFIVEYTLTSNKYDDSPRKFVVTFEINSGHIYNVTPTEREILLPYCRYVTDTPPVSCQL